MTMPSMLQHRSAIKRSWKSTFIALLAAVVLAGISVLLFRYFAGGLISGTFSALPAIVAVICLFAAFSSSGESTCPACSKPLSGLSTAANDSVLCPHCHRYFEGKNAELWATDESRVADSPLYTSPLPENFAFPDACCVCGQPQTQKIKTSLLTTNPSSALTAPAVGLTTTTRVSVEVPHCAEHKNGAMLTGTPAKPHIRFRSYPYLRSFCQLNNTTPG